MDKMVLEIKRNYIYDADRKGAKYSIDGGNKWLNGGEFNEAIFNDCLGFECAKDANTPFDVGSDIEELHMSVKSSKATLCNEILGKDM